MNYKSLIMAVLAGALVATSCMKNLESASVTKVRDAKAEELKSLAELNKAQAAAVTTLANAEASLKLAEAKIQEATAAKIAAEAEIAKIQIEIEKVKLEEEKVELQKRLVELEMAKAEHELKLAEVAQAIQDISDAMELAALKHEADMSKAYAAMLNALQNAEVDRLNAIESVINKLTNENTTIAYLNESIAAEEANLLLLENELETPSEYTLAKIANLRAEISWRKNHIEYLKECIKYDPATLNATIHALQDDLDRVNEEYKFNFEKKVEASEAYAEVKENLPKSIEKAGKALETKLKMIGDVVSASGDVYTKGGKSVVYFKDGKEYTLFTIATKLAINKVDAENGKINVPAEFDTENLTMVFEDFQTANTAKNLRKVAKEYPDILGHYAKFTNFMGVEFPYIDPLYVDEYTSEPIPVKKTAAYLSEWYEKQVALVEPDLQAAVEAVESAEEAVKEATLNLEEIKAKLDAATLAYKNGVDTESSVVTEVLNALEAIREYEPTYREAQIAYAEHPVGLAYDAKLAADAACRLYDEQYVKPAADSLTAAQDAQVPLQTAYDQALAKLNVEEEKLEGLKYDANEAYIAYMLSDDDAELKTEHSTLLKQVEDQDKAVDDAYDKLFAASAELGKANRKISEAYNYNEEVLLESDRLADIKESADEEYTTALAAKSYFKGDEENDGAEKEMAKLESALSNKIAQAKREGHPVELIEDFGNAVGAYNEAFDGLAKAESVREAANSAKEEFESVYNDLLKSQNKYDKKIKKAEETFFANIELIAEEADIILGAIEDEGAEYIAAFDKLNRLAEEYAEYGAECAELNLVKKQLNADINDLKLYYFGGWKIVTDPATGEYENYFVESAETLVNKIAACEREIVEYQRELDDLLSGKTTDELIASAKSKIEFLKTQLEAHQAILASLQAELEVILGVEETEEIAPAE